MEIPFNQCALYITATNTITDYWNDSCSVEELNYAIARGAVGATTNPSIVLGVLKSEMHLWEKRIHQIIHENPFWSESEITWKLIEEMAAKGAELLKPVFDRENKKKGRISIQTNPIFYRNADSIVRQALHFDNLAPNMQIKIPVTKAGIQAIEECTYQGVNINATVCFTVAQSIAVAEAVERGLKRRQLEGKEITTMSPVCTIMLGRTDDWMQVLAKREKILVKPGTLEWAGIACIKKAYEIFKQRGYRARLLAAAFRHYLQWSELIGGDLIMTIPYEHQVQFNASHIEVKERIQDPVPAEALDTLVNKFPDFRRAYEADGLTLDEFDTYGATVRTLRAFISSLHDLNSVVRDFMLPNPD